MKISTKSRYGLEAIVYLAQQNNKVCGVKEIAKKTGISLAYLEKIMAQLEKAKIVKSTKGAQGGYQLNSQNISVGDIVRVLENKYHLVFCIAGKKSCPKSGKCLVRSVWSQVQIAMEKTLDSIKIISLIK